MSEWSQTSSYVEDGEQQLVHNIGSIEAKGTERPYVTLVVFVDGCVDNG